MNRIVASSIILSLLVLNIGCDSSVPAPSETGSGTGAQQSVQPELGESSDFPDEGEE